MAARSPRSLSPRSLSPRSLSPTRSFISPLAASPDFFSSPEDCQARFAIVIIVDSFRRTAPQNDIFGIFAPRFKDVGPVWSYLKCRPLTTRDVTFLGHALGDATVIAGTL